MQGRIPVFDHQAADKDIEIHVSRKTKITERTRVRASRHALYLVNNLRRANLRRARDGASRKKSPQCVKSTQTLAKNTPDIRNDVFHMRIILDSHPFIHMHAAKLAHPAQVIAFQVHKHHMLRALFVRQQ